MSLPVTWTVFGAALLSAFFHASWNLLAKGNTGSRENLSGIVLATASLCVVALMLFGLPAAAAWPWLAAAAACNVLYVRLATRAYAEGDYSLVYAVVRAVIPPTMFVIGFILMAEPGRLGGVAGLVLIATSLVLFGATGSQVTRLAGLRLPILAGLVLSVALLLDVVGIRSAGGGGVELLRYTAASSILTAAGVIALSLGRGRRPLAALRVAPQTSYLGAILLLASYLTGMWAYAQGPVGLVAPLREGGILFAGLLALIVLRERIARMQWFAMGIATCGVVLIQLGP